MFSLEELNKDNFKALKKLKIKRNQKKFVLDFKGCLNYQKENPFLKIYGIKKDDTYIGLTAFARWDSDLSIPVSERMTWFDEFFLDKKYQHLGYGYEVATLILKKIQELYHPKRIVLSVERENLGAKKLYLKLGFVETKYAYLKRTDEIVYKEEFTGDDEIMMYYDCLSL